MAALDLSIVPEEHRDLVRAVMDSAFGTTARRDVRGHGRLVRRAHVSS